MATKTRNRLLPRTNTLSTWPKGIYASMRSERGVYHYGRESRNGVLCYKIGRDHAEQIERVGYRIIATGASYIYVA